MSTDQISHLEQALVAVLAAAEQSGLEIDDLRRIAIGGLMGSASWRWVCSDAVPGAIDEIERATRIINRSRLRNQS
ncbi:hypothetical protein F3J44_18620 [Pantoea sp. Tr-811]|nr:hypothetical protein [Pantoea sp. Tr-811]